MYYIFDVYTRYYYKGKTGCREKMQHLKNASIVSIAVLNLLKGMLCSSDVKLNKLKVKCQWTDNTYCNLRYFKYLHLFTLPKLQC